MNNKKRKYIFPLASLAALLHPLHAYAEGEESTLRTRIKGGIGAMGLNLRDGDPETILGLIIKSLFGFLGIVFFILMLYAGFLWMTSAGNERQLSTARSILVTSVIGILIVFTSYVITVYVLVLLRPA